MNSISSTISNHPELRGVDPRTLFDKLWHSGVYGLTLVGSDNRFIHPNPTLCRWLGYTRPKLETLTWIDVTEEEHRGEDMMAVKAVINGELSSYTMPKTYRTTYEKSPRLPTTLTVVGIHTPEGDFAVFLSQIALNERGDPEAQMDELRVIWDFVTNHKKLCIGMLAAWTFLTMTAGDRVFDFFPFLQSPSEVRE